MYHVPDRKKEFYAASTDDDTVNIRQGSAIPNDYGARPSENSLTRRVIEIKLDGLVTPFLNRQVQAGVFASLLLLLGFFLWPDDLNIFDTTTSQVAAPIIMLDTSSTADYVRLRHGSELLFSDPNFYQQTYQSFLSAQATFIKADLTKEELVYYQSGESSMTMTIQSASAADSWCATMPGLYAIQKKEPRHRSAFAGVDLPWSLSFQGNFFIHGVPEYPNGMAVGPDFTNDCIRLTNEDAERLFQAVQIGTPLLVFAQSQAGPDGFQYEPSIPDIEAPHYLIADIGNSMVLASSDLHQPVPIASITKLMTALVAAETINLDTRISVKEANLTRSVVPRLADRQTVSMYSLLQLLLIESSNEAADIIADQLGREEFVTLMNAKAEAIGMVNTTFTDPSGLDSGNVSTLSDLLRLVQYLHNNRDFILKLTADQYTMTNYDGDAFGELSNFNHLAGLDDFYGGKTGETNAAGQTSISVHRFTVRGEERLIAIAVLGSASRTQDAFMLHSYFQERFVR